MIYADSNEPADIIDAITSAGIQVEIRQLRPASDYVCGNLAIERKSSQDFYSSIYSNRLFKQLYELHSMEQYKPVLCIHGSIPVTSKWIRGPTGKPMELKTSAEETKKKTKTAIATISTALKAYPRLSVLMFKNEEQFIMFIIDYYFRMTKETEKPVLKKRVETMEDIKFAIFSQFPGVGSKGSKTMIDSKITIAELCNMTAEEIKNKFQGIGDKRSESIFEILHS